MAVCLLLSLHCKYVPVGRGGRVGVGVCAGVRMWCGCMLWPGDTCVRLRTFSHFDPLVVSIFLLQTLEYERISWTTHSFTVAKIEIKHSVAV